LVENIFIRSLFCLPSLCACVFQRAEAMQIFTPSEIHLRRAAVEFSFRHLFARKTPLCARGESVNERKIVDIFVSNIMTGE
jgi:hypothetical protein